MKSLIHIFLMLLQISAIFSVHERLKRFLLFPRGNPTRLQFIGGVGLPVDLNLESVTIGYVLKSEYFLPHNVSHFKPSEYVIGLPDKNKIYRSAREMAYRSLFDDENTIGSDAIIHNDWNKWKREADSEQKNKLEFSRWTFYRALEVALDGQGYSGRNCMLRTICEAAAVPFLMGNDNSLFDEFFHIVFLPSTSKDKLSQYRDNEYLRAEQLGRNQMPCDRIFRKCPKTPIDLISSQLHLNIEDFI